MAGLEYNLYEEGPLLNVQTAHYLMHNSNANIFVDSFKENLPHKISTAPVTEKNDTLLRKFVNLKFSHNKQKDNKKCILKWEPSKMLHALLSECIVKFCWQEKYAILESIYHEVKSEQDSKNGKRTQGITYESFVMLLAKYPCIEMAKQRVLYNYLDCDRKGYISNINFISGMLASSPQAKHDFPYNEELNITKLHCQISPVTLIRLQTIFQTANLSKDGYLTVPELIRLLNTIFSVIIDQLETKRYLINKYVHKSLCCTTGPILQKALHYINSQNLKTKPNNPQTLNNVQSSKSVLTDAIKPATKRLGELFLDTIKPYILPKANDNLSEKNCEKDVKKEVKISTVAVMPDVSIKPCIDIENENFQTRTKILELCNLNTLGESNIILEARNCELPTDIKPSEKLTSKKPVLLIDNYTLLNRLNEQAFGTANRKLDSNHVSWTENPSSNTLYDKCTGGNPPPVVIRSYTSKDTEMFSLTNESTKSSFDYKALNENYQTLQSSVKPAGNSIGKKDFYVKEDSSFSKTSSPEYSASNKKEYTEVAFSNLLSTPVNYLFILKRPNWLAVLAKQIIKVYNINSNSNSLCFFGFIKAIRYGDLLGLDILFRTKNDFSTAASKNSIHIDNVFSKVRLETIDSLWENKVKNTASASSQPTGYQIEKVPDKFYYTQPINKNLNKSCVLNQSKTDNLVGAVKKITFNIPSEKISYQSTITDDHIIQDFTPSTKLESSIEEVQLARKIIAVITTVKITGWFSRDTSKTLSLKSCTKSIIRLLPAQRLIELCDIAVKYIKQSKVHIINRQAYVTCDALIFSGLKSISDLILHPRLDFICRGSEYDDKFDNSNQFQNPVLVLLGGIKPFIAAEDCVDLIVLLLAAKILYPTRFVFLRGPYDDFFAGVSFGFEKVCCDRYGLEIGRELCRRIFDVMEYLPLLVSIQIPRPKSALNSHETFKMPSLSKKSKSFEVEWTGIYSDDYCSLDEETESISKNNFVNGNIRKIICIAGDAVDIQTLQKYSHSLNNNSEYPVSSLLSDYTVKLFNNKSQYSDSMSSGFRRLFFQLVWPQSSMYDFDEFATNYLLPKYSFKSLFSVDDLKNSRFTYTCRKYFMEHLQHDILIRYVNKIVLRSCRPTAFEESSNQQYLCYDV